jgi:hypothetical protein
LVPDPGSLTIRPTSSGRVEFQLRDEQDQPVPDYPLDFSIAMENVDGGAIHARLSTDRSLTDGKGSAVVQVIIEGLASDNRSAEFFVQAATQGAATASVYVFVTTDTYNVEIVPVAAPDLVRAVNVARTQLFFFDQLDCNAIDLTNPAAGTVRSRTLPDVVAGASCIVPGVSSEGTHAVVGLGLDTGNVARVAGCLDLPGSLLLENQTLSATLLMDHVLPVPTGTYAVSSDIPFPPPIPGPIALIQSTWQEWSRCPMDPARLWLDCTIDALVTNGTNDPNDCVPVEGGEGSLGGLLTARRGATLLSTSATGTTKPATPCRDQVDNSGKASLESTVDGLFGGSRSALTELNLASISAEIGDLLSTIHVTSSMSITPDRQPNLYLVDHTLLDVGFPSAVSPITLTASALGLPEPVAHGVQATLSPGRLVLPRHGFTLRLGTAAQYAFESTSLQKLRHAASATELVNAVAALARFSDKGSWLTGCDALDAAVCDQVGSPRGCLAGACRTGLGALAHKLSDSFSNLNGAGADFYLLGAAPVVDLNNDRHADAIGIRSSTVAVGTGLWAAEVASSLGSFGVSGSWAASGTVVGR